MESAQRGGTGAVRQSHTCGSGTFLIEAGLLAQRRPPGLDRHFSFVRFPCFDEARWEELRTKARCKGSPGRDTLLRVLEG